MKTLVHNTAVVTLLLTLLAVISLFILTVRHRSESRMEHQRMDKMEKDIIKLKGNK